MTTQMTADALAQQFSERGLSGRWLSRKQTDFLAGLASQSRGANGYDAMRHTWVGAWVSERGDSHSWSLYISPINRCGLFSVRVFTAQRAGLESEKQGLEDTLRDINERVFEKMQAHDNDAARAILMEDETRRVVARLGEIELALKEEVSTP